MASFTDDPKALGRFNPYIQQLPVEQMIDVGKRRQARYEEGVQKIQTQVDNIAGLDVIRDVDRAYLQSKLNQLGNNLRTVSAGDFSNFQLVNSVSGMTKQLTYDKGIQNGVQSAAKYRKETATMEQAEKEGKSSPANRYVFGADSSAWLNSTDVNESFNVKYQPYVDVNKKWMDVMKSLHSDLLEVDIPYERNNDGSINYNKTAAAMQRISKESVSANKIYTALKASMSPVELNQLNIDGRYTYRGSTPDALVDMSRGKYSKQLSDNDARIRELTGLANLYASKPELKKKTLDSIEAIKAQNVEVREAFEEEAEFIRANPEQAKGTLYKNEAMNTFATSNSWEHKKENLLTNPIKQQENWEKDYKLSVAEFQLKQNAQTWKQQMDVKEYKLKVKELDAKLNPGGGFGTVTAYGGENTNVKDSYTAMVNDVHDLDTAAQQGINDLSQKLKLTPTQVQNALNLYKTGNPADIQAANKIIPPHLRGLASNTVNSQLESKRVKIAVDNSEKDADNSPEIKGAIDAIDKKTAGLKPIVFKDAQGNIHKYTQKEINNFVSKQTSGVFETIGNAWDKFHFAGVFGKNSTFEGGNPALRAPLTAREKTLALVAKRSPNIMNQIKQYKDIAQEDLSAVYERRTQIRDAALDKRLIKYVAQETPITFSSEGGDVTRRYWEGVTSAAVAAYGERLNQGNAGGAEGFSEDDAKNAVEWISSEGKQNIQYSTVQQGNKNFLVLKNKGQEVMVPLTPNMVSQIKLPGIVSQSVKDVAYAQALGDGYTNPTGEFEDAYFTHINMPYISLKVAADMREDNDDPNSNYIDFKLNTPAGIIPLTVDYPVNKQTGISIIQNMDDKSIMDAYLSSPSISAEHKKIISQLKK